VLLNHPNEQRQELYGYLRFLRTYADDTQIVTIAKSDMGTLVTQTNHKRSYLHFTKIERLVFCLKLLQQRIEFGPPRFSGTLKFMLNNFKRRQISILNGRVWIERICVQAEYIP
jgi:hypothetical protein